MVRVEQHEDLYLLQELVTKTASVLFRYSLCPKFWIRKAKCNVISSVGGQMQVKFDLFHLPHDEGGQSEVLFLLP